MLHWPKFGKRIPGNVAKTTEGAINLDALDIVAAFLGSVAISLSVFYCVEWFTYNGQVQLAALAVAVVFVGFMNFSFEISLGSFLTGWNNFQKLSLVPKERRQGYFLQQLGKTLMGVLGILLSLLMLVYSIAAIVGAQYNDMMGKVLEAPKVEIVLDVDTIAKQKETLEDDKKKLVQEQTSLLDKQTANGGKLPEIDKIRLTQLPDLIDKKTSAIEAKDLESAKSKATKTNEKSLNRGTVFQYLKDTIGLDPLMGQFLASALPSIFFDLISFVSFAFLIYRKRSN